MLSIERRSACHAQGNMPSGASRSRDRGDRLGGQCFDLCAQAAFVSGRFIFVDDAFVCRIINDRLGTLKSRLGCCFVSAKDRRLYCFDVRSYARA